MIPRLKHVDEAIGDAVYEPIFLSDTPTPHVGPEILQRLRLADAAERIEAARRETGLAEFDAATWREPLEILIDSANREARLNAAAEWLRGQPADVYAGQRNAFAEPRIVRRDPFRW